MDSTATPITAKERIYTLDVIRGFALLGIFIMNMPWFNTSFFVDATGSDPWTSWWDEWTETATEVLFSGSNTQANNAVSIRVCGMRSQDIRTAVGSISDSPTAPAC